MFVRDCHTGRKVTSPKSLSWSGARASAGLAVTVVLVHILISSRRKDMMGGPPDDVLGGRLHGCSNLRDRTRPFCRLGLSHDLCGGLLRQGERDGPHPCLSRRGCLCGCVCRPLHNHPSKHQCLGARGDGRGDGRKGEG
jgi:hypothetical protein